jgi:hypothetical protein
MPSHSNENQNESFRRVEQQSQIRDNPNQPYIDNLSRERENMQAQFRFSK